jgi:cytochrome P450
VPDEEDTKGTELVQFCVFGNGGHLTCSQGESDCSGERFSRVELAAVLTVLFPNHRDDPVQEAGESATDAREKAQIKSPNIQMILSNEMYQPETLGLLAEVDVGW